MNTKFMGSIIAVMLLLSAMSVHALTVIPEVEPNNTTGAAATVLVLTDGRAIGSGAITVGDVDYWRINNVPANAKMWAYVDTGGTQNAGANSRDTILTLLGSNGIQLDFDDDGGTANGLNGSIDGTGASAIAGRTLGAGGTYYLKVQGFESGIDLVDPYRLYVVVTAPGVEQAESEPNGTANPNNLIITTSTLTGVRTGTIGVAGDEDIFAAQAAAGDIVLMIADGDPARVNGLNTGTDIVVSLRDVNGTSVLLTCNSSMLGKIGDVPSEGCGYLVPSTGTYYVSVKHASASGTGAYQLMVANMTSTTVVSFTVSFNTNGGSAVTAQSVAAGGTAIPPTPPTRTGYTFAGWFSDPGLTSAFNFATPIVADITLYAKWTLNSYTVSFNSNGGSAVNSQAVPYQGTATQPPAPTKAGNTFAGWYSDMGLTSAFNFATPIVADITLYAKWTLNSYTVSFNSNGGSAVNSQAVPYQGTATQPPAPTKAGSTFAGWYSDPGLTSAFNFATPIVADITLYANWTLNNYTVSFNSNGGSAVNSQVIPYQGTATQPPAPTKTGSTFGGWYSDIGLTSSFSFATPIVADITLYAKWTLNNYTVSFNSNGGSAVGAQVVPYQGTAAQPTAPTKTGSTFAGWYSNVGLTNAFNFSTPIVADITLYAKWTLNSYTVSFNSNGGSAVNSQVVPYQGTATQPPAPTKTGSTFGGWYSDIGLTSSFSFATPIVADITLYAKWTLNNFTVSFNSNGGTAVVSQIVAYGNQAVQPSPPTKAGNTFSGWYSDAGLTTAFNFSTPIVADITLYAKWTLNNYTVSFNSNGGSAVNSQVIPYQGTATPPAAPTRTGSTFAGWYSNVGLTNAFNFSTPIVADITLYAKWTLNSYTVSFNSNGGSAVNSQVIPYQGAATQPPAPTKTGSTFGGWYSDIGLTSSFSFATPIIADITLYAKWTLNNYTVSFNSNGGSAVSAQVIPYQGTATQPAAPTRTGSTFAGWYSNVGLTNAFNFSTPIVANITLYAKWTLNNYTVSFNSNGGSAVSAQIIPYQGTATPPSPPTKTGSTFAGWYSDPGLTSVFNFTTPIVASITLYAKWTLQNSYTVSFNSNGGSAVASQNIGSGNTAMQPVAPTRTGALFAGWYTDAQLMVPFDFGTPIVADITLYAKWDTKILDIDGDGNYDALTDGMLAIRHMQGAVGTALLNGVVAGGASRSDAEIADRLSSIHALLDIDGDGNVDPLTDGVLIIRYLFGLRGDALIVNAFNPAGSRKTAMDIEAYIASLMP